MFLIWGFLYMFLIWGFYMFLIWGFLRTGWKNPLSMVKYKNMQGHGSLLAGVKNESLNFQEPRALECVSGHGKLE
jgi:hypothetical protein